MSLLAAMPSSALILDDSLRVQDVNIRFARLLDTDARRLRGQLFDRLLLDDGALEPLLRQAAQRGAAQPPLELDLRLRRSDGSLLEARLAVGLLDDGAIGERRYLATLIHHQDPAAATPASQSAAPEPTPAPVAALALDPDGESLLHATGSAILHEVTAEGVMVTDANGVILSVNPAFTRITGYGDAEVIGHNPSLLSSHWHSQSFFVGLWRAILREGGWQGEIWNRRKDGEVCRHQMRIRRVTDTAGRVLGYVAIFAERHQPPNDPRHADHMVHYDALTRLPNRLLFESRIEHALELVRRKDRELAVFLLDLDHFANINQHISHQIGDELLRALAVRLREAIRPADTLARLGADEFGLLFEDLMDPNEVTEIARRLQRLLRTAIRTRKYELFVNVSIGITLSAGPDLDHSQVIARAETALRQAKREGGNCFRIANTTADDLVTAHRQLADLLQQGLRRGEFQLLYRNGVDMGRLVANGVQARVQWQPAALGIVPPERVRGLASDTGFMLELDQWALQTACAQVVAWQQQGYAIESLALEVSEALLSQGDLRQTLRQLLTTYPTVAGRLEIEIKETLLTSHRELLREVLEALQPLGVRVTLREVGAAWTSPAVLQRLPIQRLLIDANFIAGLHESRHDLAVVQAFVTMAQALNLEVVADGVRLQKQAEILVTIGCLKGYGRLFDEPTVARHFRRWADPSGTPIASIASRPA